MNRLLQIATLIAGTPARHRVFEPLLADWQREMQQASRPLARCAAIVAGTVGFLRALAVCAVVDGAWVPPLRGTLLSLTATSAAIAASIAVLLIAPLPANPALAIPRDLSEPIVQRWILVWSGVIVPPAFLLATFVLRRDARATHRHAIVVALLAAAAMGLVVVNSTEDALRRRYDTFELQEHMRALALKSHREGRRVYAGNSYQRTINTTFAERRASFERYRARMDAMRYDPSPTWRDRLVQVRPVMLAVLFALMGWTLAGLRTAPIPWAFAWWALVFGATITMTRVFWLVVQVPMPPVPEWLMPAFFVIVTAALAIHAVRSNHSMRSS